PQKLAARNLTTGDVVDAVREQNVQVAAGQIGAPPGHSAEFQVALNSQGRLQDEDQFRAIIIKTGADQQIVRLGDVARIELGAQDYALRGLLNNQNAVALPFFQSPGSNALQLSKDIHSTMAELSKDFPDGIKYEIIYDTSEFVDQSIDAVFHTLLEAILLVVLVVILFLQTWRASIIPLVAVPVSVIGTFAVLLAFGFSINTLSLFGLVLAIGIVVDDAIVVVENVERHIEEGLTPIEATKVAMNEVSRPIIAITLVLCAVFVPVAFVSGLTGEFYRQFALTIAISAVISAFNSLTLSPALAAVLLKPRDQQTDWLSRAMQKALGKPFGLFNRGFNRTSNAYSKGVSTMVRRTGIALAVYGGLIVLTYFGFLSVPGGFIPAQDKQYVVAVTQLPAASSLDRSEEVVRAMGKLALETPGVTGAVQFAGMSTSTLNASSSSAMSFYKLDEFSKRSSPDLKVMGLAGTLQQKFGSIQDAYIGVFPPPPIQGLGTLGGFKLHIEDRTDQGPEALYKVTQEVIGKAYQTPKLAGVFSSYQINVPQLMVNVDRVKAKQLDVKLSDVFQTMQVYLGSLYVNDFNRFGRTYQVVAQADAQFRAQKEDILRLKTRNARGEMVPLGALLTIEETFGPDVVEHYNGFRASDINGGPAPGFSSGEAEAAMSKILDETLPRGMRYEWTDLSYQQKATANTTS
ncbi:MAG TPA: efflux RND transporter permease subunit, partial [Vicinamibacterales bacterium]|nr:efflux RND transporter permease subunit [Vicinamibacterales bacterium]